MSELTGTPEGLLGSGGGTGTEGPQPHSRLAELDQVLVGGAGVQPPNVKVGFAELIRGPPGGVGAGGAQGLRWGHIGLLWGEGEKRGSVPTEDLLHPQILPHFPLDVQSPPHPQVGHGDGFWGPPPRRVIAEAAEKAPG